MAKTKNNPSMASMQAVKMKDFSNKYINRDYISKLIFDPNYISITCWLMLLAEVVLNVFIIEKVKYTEIDWIAYMQEVEGFLNGTIDYQFLKGDTGPCVYPAGFLYIYSAFYYITSSGTNIKLAQYIFLFIYMLQAYLTYEIYKKTAKIPPYAIVLCAITSYRIHSIYVLRLFNDPIAVLIFYLSLNMILSNKWRWASVLFSLAVSVKMNILLYAPCLLIAYLTSLSYKETFINLFICGLIQFILGAPFLYGNFWSYIKASFDLGRVFEHKWTVNYRFLEREIFEDTYFHLGLLLLHISLLLLFYPRLKKYLQSYATLRQFIEDLKSQKKAEIVKTKKVDAKVPKNKNKNKKNVKNEDKKPKIEVEEEEELTKEQQQFLDSFEKQMMQGNKAQSTGGKKVHKKQPPPKQEEDPKVEINFSKISQLLILPFFVTNLIGIACARSLHYQFYSWYYHSLLYLIFSTPFNKPLSFLLLGVIEYCWNCYPSTDLSSALLHLSHAALLYGVHKTMRQ